MQPSSPVFTRLPIHAADVERTRTGAAEQAERLRRIAKKKADEVDELQVRVGGALHVAVKGLWVGVRGAVGKNRKCCW